MKYQCFTVPVHQGESALEELNRFLGQKRIGSVDRHFVASGCASFWAFCVSYFDQAAPASTKSKERLDYKEILSQADFAVFAKLRQLRKTLSENEGVPPYALFNNEQLAEMVTARVVSPAQLANIAGVGKQRLQKYGPPFLEHLNQAFSQVTQNET